MNLWSNAAVNSEIFIALGSNMGDREENLLRAVAAVGRLPATRITALSPFYDTEPVGGISLDNFLNAVMRLTSSLTPQELLQELLRIETAVLKESVICIGGHAALISIFSSTAARSLTIHLN